MTNDERDELLIRMDERINTINEKLNSDYKHLHGNGSPGLIARVQALEDAQAAQEKHHGVMWGVIGFIVNAALAAYAVFKHSGAN